MVNVRSHQRRMSSGRFVPVKQHSRVAIIKGVKGRFQLSRANWLLPSAYKRSNNTARSPKTGQVYKLTKAKSGNYYSGRLQAKREVKGHHFYGAGR